MLEFHDAKDKLNAVYDPWMKTGKQGQIINAQDESQDLSLPMGPTLSDYEAANKGEFKPRYREG